MEVPTLLQQCESLTHSERVSKMVSLGKKSTTEPSIKTLITDLSSGSPYEQFLALQTYQGSHDITIAEKALASSSKHLRKSALTLISKHGTDAQISFVLNAKHVSFSLQSHILRRLRKGRKSKQRMGVIDTFLYNMGDTMVYQNLFLLGSKSLVEKKLPEYIDGFRLIDWRNLAKYYPDIAQRELKKFIENSEEDDPQLKETVLQVFNYWLAHPFSVDYALELLKNAKGKIPFTKFKYLDLGKKRPREIVEIILEDPTPIEEDYIFQDIIPLLEMDQFLALLQRYPSMLRSDWTGNATQEQLMVVYSKNKISWRDQDGELNIDLVTKLPAKERIWEARRHLKLSYMVTNPDAKIKYIALLPWDEALKLQDPFLKSSEADIRSEALKYQLNASQFNDHIPSALKMVLARKNEQDPVRNVMISALKEIKIGKWKEEHLEDLGKVVRDALDVGSASMHTIRELLNLVANLVSIFPRWAGKHMAMIVNDKEFPSFTYYFSGFENIATGITPVREVMKIVGEELTPAIQKFLRTQKVGTIVDLARAFGKASKYWPELPDACETILKDPDFDIQELISSHDSLINILKRTRPKTWWTIIPRLLDGNTWYNSSKCVISRVHHHQQNLLDLYLKEVDGEPDTLRRPDLSDLFTGFWRWTPSQQEKFSKFLIKEIEDEDTTSDTKPRLIKQLGALPFIDISPLAKLASNENPLIWEAALRTLGHSDSDSSTPILTEALNDHRARIAAYCLRPILRSMSSSYAIEFLSSIPTTKITVQKEILRLIGDQVSDSAYDYLVTKAEESDLHIDTRLALFRALRPFLNREGAMDILLSSAEDTSPTIGKALAEIPDEGMNSASRTNLLHLLLQILNHPSPEVRCKALSRLRYNPISDPSSILSSQLFELVNSEYRVESESAIQAIFFTHAKYNIEKLESMYRDLLREGKRDVLGKFYDEFMSANSWVYEKSLVPVTKMLLKVLKEDKYAVKKRVDVMFSGLPWKEILPYLLEMISELHSDALVQACKYIEDEVDNRSWVLMYVEEKEIEEVEGMLAKGEDERERRIAVSLLWAAVKRKDYFGEGKAWTGERRGRVDGYRGDESVLVAERAWELSYEEALRKEEEEKKEAEKAREKEGKDKVREGDGKEVDEVERDGDEGNEAEEGEGEGTEIELSGGGSVS